MDIESPTPGTSITVDLVTSDPERASQFYGMLLGWTCTSHADQVSCAAQGTVAARLLPPHHAPVLGWRTSFHGYPLPSAAEAVHAYGGEVLTQASPPGEDGAVMHAADPTGALFAINDTSGRRAGPPEPGLPFWHENMTVDAHAVDSFYRDALGLVPVAPETFHDPGGSANDAGAGSDSAPRDDQDGPAVSDYALLLASGRAVGGRLVIPPELTGTLPEGWMVYFAHTDPNDAALRAQRLGGRVLVPPRDAPTGRVVALADPQGAVFTLINPI